MSRFQQKTNTKHLKESPIRKRSILDRSVGQVVAIELFLYNFKVVQKLLQYEKECHELLNLMNY